MVDAMMQGEMPEVNETESGDNGLEPVPSCLLEPAAVTERYLAEALIGSGHYAGDRLKRASHAPPPAVATAPSGIAGVAMDAILQMRGIAKELPGVKALDEVNMAVRRCEILHDGRPMAFRAIRDGKAPGIVITHGELAPVRRMSVAESILPGKGIARRGVIDRRKTNRHPADLPAQAGLRGGPQTKAGGPGMGGRQPIGIAKALSQKVDPLILDELIGTERAAARGFRQDGPAMIVGTPDLARLHESPLLAAGAQPCHKNGTAPVPESLAAARLDSPEDP
ncbi:hypothetical protein DTW92_00770 [Paracoccus pantotrophus]|uniref:hypothetical protein n=1 Tax=Paracoccus pantotrophus TaxID=82367 RepID=UPI000E0992BF|nr:hypothetical protein [Paracoccus pantotrophus]RDE02091.1 hypothetical protein DTW92_00770 [Paracoccus pantotrophus]WGR64333.1 hypothetical protein E3U24_03055 [Paracoccus pantotrophus]